MNLHSVQADWSPAEQDNPFRERAAMVRMSDVEPEQIDWLWPGYLAAGKLHVVDGDPGPASPR